VAFDVQNKGNMAKMLRQAAEADGMEEKVFVKPNKILLGKSLSQSQPQLNLKDPMMVLYLTFSVYECVLSKLERACYVDARVFVR
jgi:hypothetical protein